MKFLVTKIGMPLDEKFSYSGALQEIYNFINLLKKFGHKVKVFNTKEDFDDKADVLVVFNGIADTERFGKRVEDTYKLMEFFDVARKPIFYMATDPLLQLKCFRNIRQFKNLNYIVQSFGPKEANEYMKIVNTNDENIKANYHYHLPMHLLVVPSLIAKSTTWNSAYKYNEKIFELMYVGNHKMGIRNNQIRKFYSPSDYKVPAVVPDIIGKWPSDIQKDLNIAANFHGPMGWQDGFDMLRNAKATVLIGNKKFDGIYLAQRLWENYYAGVVTFIDKNYDPKASISQVQDRYVDGFGQVEGFLIGLRQQDPYAIYKQKVLLNDQINRMPKMDDVHNMVLQFLEIVMESA